MSFSTFRTWVVVGLLMLAGFAVGSAAADPVFGPVTYERTTGATDTYNDTFSASTAGTYYLWVFNGDEGGNRVASGNISVDARVAATDADFNRNVAYFAKAVVLAAGSNSIDVALNGEPGAFITVVITRPLDRLDASMGRLVLPYSTSTNLVIDLKNGSHRFGRWVRIVFYDASGAAVAKSDRIVLDPRASMTSPVASLITSGSWSQGSVEIFYAGRGSGRVFGEAVVQELTTNVASIVPLQEAGHRRIDPFRLTTR